MADPLIFLAEISVIRECWVFQRSQIEMFKIAVRDIPSAGLEINGALSEEDLNIRADEIKCLEPLAFSGRVERAASVIRATAKAKTKFQYVCARCLESFEKDFSQEFDFHYPLDPQVSCIDLGEDIREEIILGFSVRVLCCEECKGLCIGCGANLNKEKCKCKKR